MKPEIRRVVFFPRYTALSGARTFATQPIPMREYGAAAFSLWRGDAMGGSPTVQFAIYASNDLEHWDILLGSSFVSPDEERTVGPVELLPYDWIRPEFTLGGSDPAVNCWALADFQMRVAAIPVS